MQPTRALFRSSFRKMPLTTKDVNKGFYKGTGSGRMGRHTKHGRYRVEWELVRTYVCPPLKNFGLTPFVAANVKKLYGAYEDKSGPRNPQAYLTWWKAENGVD